MVDCFCDEQFPYALSDGITFTGLLVCDTLLCCGGYIHTNDDEDEDDKEGSIRVKGIGDLLPTESQVSSNTTRSTLSTPHDFSLTSARKRIDFTDFDPHLDYIRSFKTSTPSLNRPSKPIQASSSNGKEIALNIDRSLLTENQEILLLSARKLDRHQKDENKKKIDVLRCLSKYEILLSSDIQNMSLKEGILREYEECKHMYDDDNEEDLIQLNSYLQAARNKHTTVYPDEKRVEFYQKAIQYANNLAKKKEIREEYIAFTEFLVKMARNESRLNKI